MGDIYVCDVFNNILIAAIIVHGSLFHDDIYTISYLSSLLRCASITCMILLVIIAMRCIGKINRSKFRFNFNQFKIDKWTYCTVCMYASRRLRLLQLTDDMQPDNCSVAWRIEPQKGHT